MNIDKLTRLEENLKTLEQFRNSYSLDDIISNKIDEWGLRYGLFESIQIIIDISCSIVANKNLGTPKNYSECISLLVSNDYLNKDLGEKIKSMIGLRNLLIHEYGIIEVNKLFANLDHINDVRNFIQSIKSAL
ncbi:MAG: DUF86 domain-containing protein [Ignavibacteriota bacterium]|jgi:uncharacterized protein YutE (UPF0331/DUF86 family)|nr:MAG: DUF86 domain-containing protein [Chlorobiota bacterium]MBE7477373.1 DUF86 domain-containing protein [Ignavibacteriales bacterium]MBL1122774.1 DUF86 domain-containing protein [Ignavibacteriota bacterium]MCC7094243.1 DUF86 domain-containing protein [Ignavibacteriaceae bacterium]MCE7855794.1 DUF86 domain-containing protein [Ignavibacteria bacterium CHB3]